MDVMKVMNVPDSPKTSPDCGSFVALHRRTSRVKSPANRTIPGNRARLCGGRDSLGNNSFSCNDLSASYLIAHPLASRQVYCYEVS